MGSSASSNNPRQGRKYSAAGLESGKNTQPINPPPLQKRASKTSLRKGEAGIPERDIISEADGEEQGNFDLNSSYHSREYKKGMESEVVL